MVNQRLIEYFKKGLRKGHSLDTLKKALLKQGYNISDVDKALATLKGERKKSKTIFFIVGVVIVALIFLVIQQSKQTDCEKLEEYKRDECYFEIAVSLDDFSLCSEILENDILNHCKAITLKDLKLCDNIIEKGTKHLCYMGVAFFSNNPSICNKIPDFNISTLCEAITLKDSSICENLMGEERDSCYLYFVQSLKSPVLLCDKIVDKSIKEECKETTK